MFCLGEGNIMVSRIKCVDILRGFAIAAMLACDSPGNTDRFYPQMRHEPWNGINFSDFGFPFFLITMTMMIPIVMGRKLDSSAKIIPMIIKTITRSITLVLLGLFLNAFPKFDFHTMRIPQTLVRMGIAYLVVSIIYIIAKKFLKKDEYIIGLFLLLGITIILGYYFKMKPYGFDINGNLEQIIDTKYLAGHLAYITWDPEGIMSTIPSIATGMFGVVIGGLLNFKTNNYYKVLSIAVLSTVGYIGAKVFSNYMPYNKMIWSSSYVLITMSVTALIIAVLYLICDTFNKDRLFKPFIVLGSSPIFVYMVSELLIRTLWKVPIYDKQFTEPYIFCKWFTFKFITPWAGIVLDSFYFSILYVIFWMWIMSKFYEKGKFIKL
jgi:predicted acyltransferase